MADTCLVFYFADDPRKRAFSRVHLGGGNLTREEAVAVAYRQGVPENNTRTIVYEEVPVSQSWPMCPAWIPAGEDWPPAIEHYEAPPSLVQRVLALAEVGPDDTVIDLGSGLAPFLIAAAQRGATAIGYEIDQRAITLARQKIEDACVEVKIIDGNYRDADVSIATVVIINVGSEISKLSHLKYLPGTRVVTIDNDQINLRVA